MMNKYNVAACKYRLRRGARRQRGVMLLEVLVSILILSFGILGVVAIQARAVQYSTNAEDRNRAALLANEMASAMWLRQSNDVVGNVQLAAYYADWQDRISVAAADGLPGGVGTVSAVVGNTVTITVAWAPTFGGPEQRFETQVTM